jgi:hypothetical protein
MIALIALTKHSNDLIELDIEEGEVHEMEQITRKDEEEEEQEEEKEKEVMEEEDNVEEAGN